MKRNCMLGLLVLTAVMFVGSGLASAEDYKIVGAKKCGMCHKKKTGDQLKLWQESKHATAFLTLKTDRAAEVAKEQGVEGNAWESPDCLFCHDTQAFLGAELDAKSKYVPEEGVGCEACHGAGSAYKKMSVMKDGDKARANGLLDMGEDGCVRCHNEKSPTYVPFDYAKRSAQVAHPIVKKAKK